MKRACSVGINFDEISDDFPTAVALMHELGVANGELRTVNGQNFVNWGDNQVEEFGQSLTAASLSLVAAATPLFKWYSDENAPEIPHDSFGFNPRLDVASKLATITRTLDIAKSLRIPRLRIFSELGIPTITSTREFAGSELLTFALQEAAKREIDLYLENEPVCRIHTSEAIVEFLQANPHPNLKLWLDIANLLQVGESVSDDFLKAIAPRLGYVHVKDFTMTGEVPIYCALGKGSIDYAAILPSVLDFAQHDLVVTVETHAKSNKVSVSRESLVYLQSLIGPMNNEMS